MNSIRRPRRRPRVRSVNLRVLSWVLLREAAIRVLDPTVLGTFWEVAAREYLAHLPSHRVRWLVEDLAAAWPERLYWPRRK